MRSWTPPPNSVSDPLSARVLQIRFLAIDANDQTLEHACRGSDPNASANQYRVTHIASDDLVGQPGFVLKRVKRRYPYTSQGFACSR